MSNNFVSNCEKNFTLDMGKVGSSYTILHCTLPRDVKIRFAEMGLVKGTVVKILLKAPLGDPIEIYARNYSLCIRASDAKHFFVAEINI